jgi:AhpD family alkylhydroperoxidase
MTRLYSHSVSEASGQAAQIFAGIKSAVGMVPNAYASIGSNHPAALAALLNLDATLRQGSLTTVEAEVVKLVVSEAAACDYCLAAHTLMGKRAEMSKESILAFRQGDPSGDAHLDALAQFVRALVGSSGVLPDSALAAVKQAGYTDKQLVDVVLAITSITFTNLFNRINDTKLDFPPAD